MRKLTLVILLLLAVTPLLAQKRPRARDLGIPFDGLPGPKNALTDVPGVEVGMVTLIRDAPRADGKTAAVRTGVTAILPRGKASAGIPVFGGWFPLNGNGEMTGTHWLDESGFLEGPILITNTHSVGVVRDAVVRWQVAKGFLYQDYSYPMVAETYDGYLNDINGFHVTPEDAIRALDQATTGPVAEGNVGGGTGMICYEFKCGTGTASRKLRGRRRPHGRRPRSGEPRRAVPAAGRGSSRRKAPAGQRAPYERARPRQRARVDHHRRRHGRAAPPPPAEAPRQARRPRSRPDWLPRGQRFRRHLRGVLDGQPECAEARSGDGDSDLRAERPAERHLQRRRARDGGSDRERTRRR